VTVNWATATAGTATAGADFTAANGTLTFAPGETSKTIAVTILADLLDEPTETVFVNLSGNSANSNLLDAQGQGNIVDNDPTPSISVADITVAEGNAGTTNAVFTFTLSAVSGQTVTVNYATADGNASAGAGLGENDYEARSGVLTIPAGAMSRTVTVQVNGDAILEPAEAFTIGLSAPVNAVVATASATATITNDDAQPTLAIVGGAIAEGAAGQLATFNFRVTLSAPSLGDVTVRFSTTSGTATGGSDYNTVTNALVTLPAGVTQVNRSVTIIGDAAVEANEAFNGNLANAVGATIATATATCTINNDD
jgi:chitinase